MLDTDHRQHKPRVLIADDQVIVAAGICALIEPECEVIGMVEDGRALIIEAEKLRPDVVVMEVLLPSLNGLDAARYITKVVPQSKIVFCTIQGSSRHVADAFKAGASAYVLKRSSPAELSQAIHAAMKGQCYLTPLITKDVLAANENGSASKDDRAGVSSLTPRQREVLQLIAEGRGTKEVATLLNISVKTVEFHKFRIMDQLNLHSTVALAKHALAEGLITQ